MSFDFHAFAVGAPKWVSVIRADTELHLIRKKTRRIFIIRQAETSRLFELSYVEKEEHGGKEVVVYRSPDLGTVLYLCGYKTKRATCSKVCS